MDSWLLPWKPFILLIDMSQLVSLVDSLPQPWTTIWFTLFTIYCVFLVIRVNPWFNFARSIPPKVPFVKQQGMRVSKPRHRKRSRRYRSR